MVKQEKTVTFERPTAVDFKLINGCRTIRSTDSNNESDDDADDESNEIAKPSDEEIEMENVLAKAATFVYIFFQLCYFYFIDIFKRAVYLTNLHHQSNDRSKTCHKISSSPTVESLSQQENYNKFFSDSFVPKSDVSEASAIERQIKESVAAESSINIEASNIGRSILPVQTRYSTTVFEVSNQNLNSIIGEVIDEIRLCRPTIGENEFLACGEIVWSVPNRFRNYPAEIRLRNEIAECMRINGHHLWDGVRRHERRPVQSDGLVEETVENCGSRCSGLYRKYYLDLLATAHVDTQLEHDPFWRFDQNQKRADASPTIGSVENTIFVKLSFVYLRF